MRHASLFSGIGGFDLAAQWMGWENVFQVEIDKFCQKVLEKNFPNVQRYGDIKEFKGDSYRGTIDVLSGGFPCQPFSVAGKRKGKEDDRHLWPEMFRVIREVKPRWIVGENVTGIIGLALDQVLTEMESEGYNTETYIIPACGVNAPHRRDRVWIVANTNGDDAVRCRYDKTRQAQGVFEGQEKERQRLRPVIERTGKKGITTNTISQRLEVGELEPNGKERSPTFGSNNQWENWPTKPGVCGGNDVIPNRMDRIKSLGNAIVPQVAFEIFKAIEAVQEPRKDEKK